MQMKRLVSILMLYAVAPIPADFDSIRKEIENYELEHPGRTLTVESILARLPENFRSSFTLMHTSESLQRSSFEAPRVIMFGQDARTVMAFNGDPQHSSYARLEFATFDPLSQDIAFRMIEFPQGDSGNGRAAFSEKNPPLCMGCHGPTPHYIWAQYAQWPGSYGSRDDVLDLAEGEKSAFQQFRQIAGSHARYKSLLFPYDTLSPVAPYRPLQDGRPGTDRGDYKVAIEFRPNFRLGAFLMRHQAQARATEITRSSEFESHRYGFLFYLAGCHDRFQSPLASAMNKATGKQNHSGYAALFGPSPSQGWHLDKGPEAFRDYDYSPGLNSFRAGLLGHIWPLAVGDDEALAAFWKPIRIADYVRSFDTIGFKVSEEGQAMWEALDREGPIPSGVAGSGEADNYGNISKTPMLTLQQGLEMCRILAQKHLER
ncbi:MAG: hypothetical protein M3Q07_15120 [Pseudobdellovibrionaceae bacterium]|nr:hypothetical protein [Pseudobdellovibrionaceae bacterium]